MQSDAHKASALVIPALTVGGSTVLNVELGRCLVRHVPIGLVSQKQEGIRKQQRWRASIFLVFIWSALLSHSMVTNKFQKMLLDYTCSFLHIIASQYVSSYILYNTLVCYSRLVIAAVLHDLIVDVSIYSRFFLLVFLLAIRCIFTRYCPVEWDQIECLLLLNVKTTFLFL